MPKFLGVFLLKEVRDRKWIDWTFQAAQQLLGGINYEIIMTDYDLALMITIKIYHSNAKKPDI